VKIVDLQISRDGRKNTELEKAMNPKIIDKEGQELSCRARIWNLHSDESDMNSEAVMSKNFDNGDQWR
jgi:hypothetical protein